MESLEFKAVEMPVLNLQSELPQNTSGGDINMPNLPDCRTKTEEHLVTKMEQGLLSQVQENVLAQTEEDLLTKKDEISSAKKDEILSVKMKESLNSETETKTSLESKELVSKDLDGKVGKHQCEHCEMSFELKYSLIKHVRMKHKQNKIYKCKECGLELPNHFYLNSHARVHKPQKKKKLLFCSTKNVRNKLEEKSYLNNLHTKKPTRHRTNSIASLNEKHPVIVNVEEPKEEKIEESLTVRKKYELMAGESFVTDKPLVFQNHDFRRWLPPQMKYKCQHTGCRYSTNGQVSLAIHGRIMHEGVVPWKCKHCWKMFPTEGKLKGHVQIYHTTSDSKINADITNCKK